MKLQVGDKNASNPVLSSGCALAIRLLLESKYMLGIYTGQA